MDTHVGSDQMSYIFLLWTGLRAYFSHGETKQFSWDGHGINSKFCRCVLDVLQWPCPSALAGAKALAGGGGMWRQPPIMSATLCATLLADTFPPILPFPLWAEVVARSILFFLTFFLS